METKKAYALYVITERGEDLFGIFHTREDAQKVVESYGEDICDPGLYYKGVRIERVTVHETI